MLARSPKEQLNLGRFPGMRSYRIYNVCVIFLLILISFQVKNFFQGVNSNQDLSSNEHLIDTFTLSNGSEVKIISKILPKSFFIPILNHLEIQLKKYQNTFGDVPAIQLRINFLTSEEFLSLPLELKAVKGLYQKNQIFLTYRASDSPDSVLKILSHEFAHALNSSLSNDNCPRWLDEGIALIAESDHSYDLIKIIYSWLEDTPILTELFYQNNFTGINKELMPVAYAQSFLATKYLLDMGYSNEIRKYLGAAGDITLPEFWEMIQFDPEKINSELNNYHQNFIKKS